MWADARPLFMQQAWRTELQPEFRAAQVRVGWKGSNLYVEAELQDDDIFNPVNAFNAPAFTEGDVFEMFVRPVDQAAYFEFHVTPDNQLFQLRIPSAETFLSDKNKPVPPDYTIRDWKIASQVEIFPDENRWQVRAVLPMDRLVEGRSVGKGMEWLMSFSRYDYTRGQAEPVLSSTSPHREVNFHRQQEWSRWVLS